MGRKDFLIFDNIIDNGSFNNKLKWSKGHNRAILEEIDPQTGLNIYKDGYYSVLMEDYHHVDYRDFDFDNNKGKKYYCRATYYESKKHHIAQVLTYPREITSVASDPLTTSEKGEIAVATYCKNSKDEVVIVNRFDAVGFNKHANDYSIYGALAPTYDKYFSDGHDYYMQTGGVQVLKPFASIPHFHFQSPDQTVAHGQESCNAISIVKLQQYLDALSQGTDPVLQRESLGMPFLSYFKNERTYHSTMEADLVKLESALQAKGDSCDIPVINYMRQMIAICRGYNNDDDHEQFDVLERNDELQSFVTTQPSIHKTYTSTVFPYYNLGEVNGHPSFIPMVGTEEGFDNIQTIQRDLKITQCIINKCQDHPEIIATIASSFMGSLNAPEKQREEELGSGLYL